MAKKSCTSNMSDIAQATRGRRAPGARRSEALEQPGRAGAVSGARAIDDDALRRNRPRHRLDRLCLAGARGARDGGAKAKVQRAKECPVAPIGKRRHGQAATAAKVLAAVLDLGVRHPHHDLRTGGGLVMLRQDKPNNAEEHEGSRVRNSVLTSVHVCASHLVALPAVTQLARPGKVGGAVHLCTGERVRDVAPVHVGRNEARQCRAL